MMRSGFSVGIDLGTSNTVAILRWPDGRTRSLLLTGTPVMPSAIFLDDEGWLRIGVDAQRMASHDPARFDPNPKRRIDDGAVLLGSVEVPVVALLAAVLRTVANTAVEAAGALPPAVITHPAAWGGPRRELLRAAARHAGWPEVELVPEPVAAARYFIDVLGNEVRHGDAVAVFDVGGGTIDVAVVRREADDTLTVRSTGGLNELGGLDVDAALVARLGELLAAGAPEVWRQLADPRTAEQRRSRRAFWDEVRAAKETLSRHTTAPVAVPGLNGALHLTRDELERVAEPLLRPAVEEAAATLARSGRVRIAGLFLVGAGSRMPLIGRLLHARLGIPPMVLEQPELVVAEGALVERVRVSAPRAGDTAAAGAAVDLPAQGAPPDLMLPPPGRSRRRRWIPVAAGIAVVAVAGGAYWMLQTRGGGGAIGGPVGALAKSITCPTNAKIALMGALTGSNSGYTTPIRNGVKLALQQFKEQHKCDVKLEEADTQGEPGLATSAVNRLVGDAAIRGVVGPMFGGESRATARTFEAASMPWVSPSVTANELTASGYKAFHRLTVNDAVQAPAAGRYMAKVLNVNRVVIVTDDSAYGKTLTDGARGTLGSKLVGTEQIQIKQAEFSAVVQKVKSLKPDAVYFAGYSAEGGPFLKHLRSVGVNAYFVSGEGMYGEDFVKAAGPASAGAVVTSGSVSGESTQREFYDAYRKAYGQPPGTYSGEGYDAAMILLSAIGEGKKREEIPDYIRTYNKVGVSKTLKFTKSGDIDAAGAPVWAHKVVNGKFEPEKEIPRQ